MSDRLTELYTERVRARADLADIDREIAVAEMWRERENARG